MIERKQLTMVDYGIFDTIIDGKPLVIYTKDITKANWGQYYKNLLDLFKDYIEVEEFQRTMITFIFDNGSSIELNVEDSLINICMWGFIINNDNRIEPKHIFFEKEGITSKSIKKYIDTFCIIPNRMNHDFFELNETIYTSMKSLSFVDKFAMYFNNSINIEDFIEMSICSEEFNSILHKDYSNLPSDKMNQEAMKDTNRLVELILDSKRIMGREHCFINAFRAKEGINVKQFREFATDIGVKPNGSGGIFPYSIDSSYLVGGLNTIESMVADAGIGRIAQIITKKNTADSGAFARLVNTNNRDTKLYCEPGTSIPDPSYDCHTTRLVRKFIPDLRTLSQYIDRYYRFTPKGIEYNIGCGSDINENHRDIGRYIYLRSPMTCASAAKGLGICRKCYGNLFYTNKHVNVGVVAATNLTRDITQTMLSAKHLLEAKVISIRWCDDVDLDRYLYIDDNIIYINPELQVNNKWCISIDVSDINVASHYESLEDSEETSDSEEEIEYINSFKIINDKGEAIDIHTKNYDELFITKEFSNFAYKYRDDNTITIPIYQLQQENIPMFELSIINDDLNNKLKKIFNVMNIKAVTESFTLEEALEQFISALQDCNLDKIKSVHVEVILMNQIRSKSNILETPDWDIPGNEDYQILTLNRALSNNPSITVSLQFNNIAKTLYTPLSFKKNKASQIDLYYHLQPQNYIKSEVEEDHGPVSPFTKVDD